MPGGDEFIHLIHHLQMIVLWNLEIYLAMEIAMEITNEIQFSPISVNLFFLWRVNPQVL